MKMGCSYNNYLKRIFKTMAERMFDQILKDAGKVYDEKMLPLIEEETKAKFHDAVREGKKLKIQMEIKHCEF